VIHLAVVAPNQAMRAGLRALLSIDAEIAVISESASLASLEEQPLEIDVIVCASPLIPQVDSRPVPHEEPQAPAPAGVPNPFESEGLPPALLLLTDGVEAVEDLVRLRLRSWGILPMDASAEELAVAVRALHEGLLVGSPYLLASLLEKTRQPSHQNSLASLERGLVNLEPLVEPLTGRETEVLQLLAQGLANKQVAVSLGISEHTVKFHVSSIYAKLGAGNRTEAVRAGVQRGLIVL
jgi:NarL family two-component system response regulator YdfI